MILLIAELIIMETKHDNFLRISNNRVNKIIDLISKLHNLSNASYYEYSDEEIQNLFDLIQQELDRQKALFEKDKIQNRKVEL